MFLFAILRHDRVRYAKNNHELKCVEFCGEFFMSWKILTYLTYREGTLGSKILKNHKNLQFSKSAKSQTSSIFGEAVNGPIPMIFRCSVRFICLVIRKNTFIRISLRNHDFFCENASKYSKNPKITDFQDSPLLSARPPPVCTPTYSRGPTHPPSTP